jgi:hypothetical protein
MNVIVSTAFYLSTSLLKSFLVKLLLNGILSVGRGVAQKRRTILTKNNIKEPGLLPHGISTTVEQDRSLSLYTQYLIP